MAYKDMYKKYLDEIASDIQKCKKSKKWHVFGYTSDLDIIVEWNSEIFNEVLKKYLKEEPYTKEGETIDSKEDFARIVSYYAIKGLGGEIDITNEEVCTYLEENFEIKYSLGGTCAQGAAALNTIGFPVIAHLTDKSSEVCNIINNQEFYLVNDNGLISIKNVDSDELPVKHNIIQYSKGVKIRIGNKEYSVPVSNRLIADYDKIHKYLPIEKPFLDYCEKNAKSIYSYNISGFNSIVDINILKERLSEFSEHYEKIKKNNPDCIIYLESAHYLNKKSKIMVFDRLSKYIDILGMNEEELVDLAEQLGFFVDKNDVRSVISGLDKVIEQYHLKSIVMHTKDYSMFYGDDLKGINIEKGLTLGNLLSGTRARIGKYGDYEDCLESLNLELSPIGIEFADQLRELKTEKNAFIVPSRYMEHPNCTIGLGDTFVAGMQICFTK